MEAGFDEEAFGLEIAGEVFDLVVVLVDCLFRDCCWEGSNTYEFPFGVGAFEFFVGSRSSFDVFVYDLFVCSSQLALDGFDVRLHCTERIWRNWSAETHRTSRVNKLLMCSTARSALEMAS